MVSKRCAVTEKGGLEDQKSKSLDVRWIQATFKTE